MESLKVVSFAHKIMEKTAYDEMVAKHGNIEADDFLLELQEGMTYLGSFGFHDDERTDIKQTVQLIRYGMISGDVPSQEREEQVFVRLVSGDHA